MFNRSPQDKLSHLSLELDKLTRAIQADKESLEAHKRTKREVSNEQDLYIRAVSALEMQTKINNAAHDLLQQDEAMQMAASRQDNHSSSQAYAPSKEVSEKLAEITREQSKLDKELAFFAGEGLTEEKLNRVNLLELMLAAEGKQLELTKKMSDTTDIINQNQEKAKSLANEIAKCIEVESAKTFGYK